MSSLGELRWYGKEFVGLVLCELWMRTVLLLLERMNGVIIRVYMQLHFVCSHDS